MAPGKKDKLTALKAMQAEFARKMELLDQQLQQLAKEEEDDRDDTDGEDHPVDDGDYGDDGANDDDDDDDTCTATAEVSLRLSSQTTSQASHRLNHTTRKTVLPLVPRSVSVSPEDVGHPIETKKRLTEEESPTERYLIHKRSKTNEPAKKAPPPAQHESGPSKKAAKRPLLPKTPVSMMNVSGPKDLADIYDSSPPIPEANFQQSQAPRSQQHDLPASDDEAGGDDDDVIDNGDDSDNGNNSINQRGSQGTRSNKKATATKATTAGSHQRVSKGAKHTKTTNIKAPTNNSPGVDKKGLSRSDLNERMGIYAGGVDLKTANQVKRLRRQWVLEECLRKGLDLRAPFNSYSYQNKMYPTIKHITSLAPPEWGWDRDVTKDVIHTLCQDRVRSINRRTDGPKGKPRGPQAVSKAKGKSKMTVELSDIEEPSDPVAISKTTRNIPRLFVPDPSTADKSSPPVSNTSAANTPRADTVHGKANKKIPIRITVPKASPASKPKPPASKPKPPASKSKPSIFKKNAPNKLASRKRSITKDIDDILQESQFQATPSQEQVDDTFQVRISGEIHTFAKDIDYQEFDEIVGNYLIVEKDEMRYYRASYGTGRDREWKPLNYPEELNTAIEKYGDLGIELMIRANAEEFASGGEEPDSQVTPINKTITAASKRGGNNMTKHKVATPKANEDLDPKDSQLACPPATDPTSMEIYGADTGSNADMDIVQTDALITPPDSQTGPEPEKRKPGRPKKTDTTGGEDPPLKRKRGRPPGSKKATQTATQIDKESQRVEGGESQKNENTNDNSTDIGEDDEETGTQTRRSRRKITKSRRVQDNEEYGKEMAYANELVNAKKNLKRERGDFEQRYPPAYLKWLPTHANTRREEENRN